MSVSCRNRAQRPVHLQSRKPGKPRGPKPSSSGFILVEAMVAVTVVAIGLTGLLATQREGMRLAIHGKSITEQVSAVRDILELMHLHRHNLPLAGFTFTANPDDIPTDAGTLSQFVQRRLHRLSRNFPGIHVSGQCSAAGTGTLCTFCLLTPSAALREGDTPVCAGPALL